MMPNKQLVADLIYDQREDDLVLEMIEVRQSYGPCVSVAFARRSFHESVDNSKLQPGVKLRNVNTPTVNELTAIAGPVDLITK